MKRFVETLLQSSDLAGQIVHHAEVPRADARWAEPRDGLEAAIREAAGRLGAKRLYSHQAAAVDRIRAGRDVAIVTPTASGKSLIHYLPTAEALAQPGGHVLYLFPHKALEQDQLKKLEIFGRNLYGLRSLTADVYDGDTPQARRRKIRKNPPDVLITNPDMLHLGLLGYHGEWARFFGALRLVVVDELHVYRGIFGSHFAHVMRRLARVTAHYGADPRYLVSSATVGNPERFTRSLFDRGFDVISDSGSPRSPRHFVFVNPSGSPYTAATRIFLESVQAGLRTIAFTKARKITELIHSWVQQQAPPEIARRIAPYRAGYLAEERREIERRLFSGELAGVVATSALELGIDVGGLDACVLVGYPGSMMSAWQRIGRVGREDRDSLVVLVAQPDALDQYFMSYPQEFFTRAFEPAVVDPSNPVVAGAHLVCAGAELPLSRTEATAYAGGERLEELLALGRLVEDGAGDRFYALKRNPQRDVNLRSGGESYTILADEGSRAIGTIDGVRVFHECHEGAIYLHAGTSFRVVLLDREAKRVLAVPFSGDYYTQALGEKQTRILETFRRRERGGYELSLGRLEVTVRIGEYARKRLFDQATISKHPLDLPPIVFETVGFWLTFPNRLAEEAARRELHFMGGLHAAEHTMIALFPLLALCDRSDVGGISYSCNPELGAPAIFVYDGYPGGIGLAAAVHDRIEDLIVSTRDLLDRCPCEAGCPSCVQSPRCGSGNRPLDKQAARLVLRHLAGDPLGPGIVASARLGEEARTSEAGRGEAERGKRSSTGASAIRARAEEPRHAIGESSGAAGRGAGSHVTDALPMNAGAAAAREAEQAQGAAPARTGGSIGLDDVLPLAAACGGRPVGRPPPTRGGSERPAPRATVTSRPPADSRAMASRGAALQERPAAMKEGASLPGAEFDPGTVRAPFRLRAGEGQVLFFDVETQRSAEEVGGWGHIPDMGLALAVVYDAASDRFTTYFEKDVEKLVLALVMADLVVGYNSERFDLAVLSGYGTWDLSRIRSLDMLKEIHRRLGFRLRLGDLAEANLGAGKSADGLQSLAWFKEGRLDLIEDYCRRDVEVTARLFYLGRERGYLLYRDRSGRAVRLPVGW